MCELGPTGAVGGMTTMLVMPANVPPLTSGPWQAEQPLVMPAWFICPPAKLVKPVCVEAMWHVPHSV